MSCPTLPATRGSAEAKDFGDERVCVLRECIEALGTFQEPTIEELSGGTMH
jgi:hypothetical protein